MSEPEQVDRPARMPPPPEWGRLGLGLSFLAGAQGGWPAAAPRRVHHVTAADRPGGGYAAGRREADALADSGVDLLTVDGAGDGAGEGDTAPALAVLCALLDVEPVLAVGPARDPGWAARLVAVRDGLLALRPHVGDPQRLLRDPDLGRLAGLLAGSALRRTPVILGPSVPVAAAALVAERIAPGARWWWLAGVAPTERAAQLAHAELALEPLLELGLTEPCGAALAGGLLLDAVGRQRA